MLTYSEGVSGVVKCGDLRKMAHAEQAWKLSTLSPCLAVGISSTWLFLRYILLQQADNLIYFNIFLSHHFPQYI